MNHSLREGGFLVAKVHQLAGRIFAKKLKKYQVEEINPAQGRILFALWQQDGIPIQELAKKTALEKSTLTSMLDRLESMGYLMRVHSKEDRRKILIRLTPKNAVIQAAHQQVSAEMNALFYQGFAANEIDQFEENLRRILENLTVFEENQQNEV